MKVGCQKALWILLHCTVRIFSHPIRARDYDRFRSNCWTPKLYQIQTLNFFGANFVFKFEPKAPFKFVPRDTPRNLCFSIWWILGCCMLSENCDSPQGTVRYRVWESLYILYFMVLYIHILTPSLSTRRCRSLARYRSVWDVSNYCVFYYRISCVYILTLYTSVCARECWLFSTCATWRIHVHDVANSWLSHVCSHSVRQTHSCVWHESSIHVHEFDALGVLNGTARGV